MTFTTQQIDDLVDNAKYAEKKLVESRIGTAELRQDLLKIIVRADAESIRDQKAKPIPRAMPQS